MASIFAIRGLLLEEVLLKLLETSGYLAIESEHKDITLNRGSSGLEVKGRGSNHQIDAIADFSISPPFSYPVRLLLEAKFYTKPVGIEIVRNAVGVLKDVNEFWFTTDKLRKPRYHYQYAIFASSSFTKPAQEYASVQDVYLIKLQNNKYFIPVIEAIEELEYCDFGGESDKKISIGLNELRKVTRKSLKLGYRNDLENYATVKSFNSDKLKRVIDETLKLGKSYLGTLGGNFPIFLTPSDAFKIEELIYNPKIRICWNNHKWLIVKATADCQTLAHDDILFSFDLPGDLFNLYADNNMLSPKNSLDLKEDFMSSIQIVFKDPNLTNALLFLDLKLDNDWLRNMRDNIRLD